MLKEDLAKELTSTTTEVSNDLDTSFSQPETSQEVQLDQEVHALSSESLSAVASTATDISQTLDAEGQVVRDSIIEALATGDFSAGYDRLLDDAVTDEMHEQIAEDSTMIRALSISYQTELIAAGSVDHDLEMLVFMLLDHEPEKNLISKVERSAAQGVLTNLDEPKPFTKAQKLLGTDSSQELRGIATGRALLELARGNVEQWTAYKASSLSAGQTVLPTNVKEAALEGQATLLEAPVLDSNRSTAEVGQKLAALTYTTSLSGGNISEVWNHLSSEISQSEQNLGQVDSAVLYTFPFSRVENEAGQFAAEISQFIADSEQQVSAEYAQDLGRLITNRLLQYPALTEEAMQEMSKAFASSDIEAVQAMGELLQGEFIEYNPKVQPGAFRVAKMMPVKTMGPQQERLLAKFGLPVVSNDDGSFTVYPSQLSALGKESGETLQGPNSTLLTIGAPARIGGDAVFSPHDNTIGIPFPASLDNLYTLSDRMDCTLKHEQEHAKSARLAHEFTDVVRAAQFGDTRDLDKPILRSYAANMSFDELHAHIGQLEYLSEFDSLSNRDTEWAKEMLERVEAMCEVSEERVGLIEANLGSSQNKTMSESRLINGLNHSTFTSSSGEVKAEIPYADEIVELLKSDPEVTGRVKAVALETQVDTEEMRLAVAKEVFVERMVDSFKTHLADSRVRIGALKSTCLGDGGKWA